MKIAKFPHYVKKLYQLGPRTAAKVISNRMQNSFFEQYARYQADHKKAAYLWPFIAHKHGLGEFTTYWSVLQKRSLSSSEELYEKQLADTESLMRQADSFANNCFDILGSRDQCLMVMPWHSDFRLRYQRPDADYLFDKTLFYKDIAISSGLTDRLVKDIKVPWELSRCAHFFVLGAAFKKSNELVYARAFQDYVQDWLDENPFLLGPNWVCPMDVGIRAFNWVWAFHFFKDSKDIDPAFWERFVSSLYDHLTYLENNWEVYDKTSNHYLSDLIGYYALTWFFGDLKGMAKKASWCHKQLLKEFEKQVFEEGTDYEGSTAYHRLVTEIFYHSYLFSQEHGFSVPESFLTKLRKMFSFIDWCSVADQELVKIGDDDSGKLLYYGITQELVNELKTTPKVDEKEKFFREFGLAVHKDAQWHVTLRHHAYQPQQPSGHFHNDVASVTLAIKGIPVFVDPGSYVYTPSEVWRNQFRSISAHNSFYVEDVEPVLFTDRSLFTLDLPENKVGHNPWKVTHNLYSIPASRTVSFENEKTMLVEDVWEEVPGNTFTSCWNFTLAAHITAQKEGSLWRLLYEDELLATFHCEDLVFERKDSWFAPGYGHKVPCSRLVARCDLGIQPVKIRIKRA